ncbi:MAG: magnesium/cobalt transporter CorA [Candidatus Veblenbacteria bacterium]|nr:magnesium/cobalt transporter CorA [Candidatus Veblenbacteria bacterium]
MVTLCVVGAKPRCSVPSSLGEVAALLKRAEPVWVDFDSPTPEEAKLLSEVFKFHRLSIEDCFDHVHYPKIEQFPNYLFVILHVLEVSNKRRLTTEVDFFLTPKFLVTVHQKSSVVLEAVRKHLVDGALTGYESPDMLFQAISSRYVDEYLPVLDELDDQIDHVEDAVFKSNQGGAVESTALINQFLISKKKITTLRRLLTPQRDVFSRLSRNEFSQVSPAVVVYFRDIYDRLFRITELLDSFRDVLSSTLEAHLSVVSNRLNEVMKVLTIVTVILLPLTVITGVYGMNFRYMPELARHWGYPWALGLMVVVAGGLVLYFKRRRWL